MPLPLPDDFDLTQAVAIAFLFGAWFSYGRILKTFSRGSLNEQLTTVRAEWLVVSLSRGQKPFDAILLGHIVHSIAFFGSATLIVLAGVITLFASAQSVYEIVVRLSPDGAPSFELFVFHIAVLNVTLAIAFFSFTYALRKLIYVLALVGALPEGELDEKGTTRRKIMVADASIVLSEALMTFNFGIRGYYYFVAVLGLFISPYLSVLLTMLVTAVLIYRQIGTTTARAIKSYVDVAELPKPPTK